MEIDYEKVFSEIKTEKSEDKKYCKREFRLVIVQLVFYGALTVMSAIRKDFNVTALGAILLFTVLEKVFLISRIKNLNSSLWFYKDKSFRMLKEYSSIVDLLKYINKAKNKGDEK